MAPVSFSEPPIPQPHTQRGPVENLISPPQSQTSSVAVSPTTSIVPTVSLDVDIVTDSIAARLASSLLGHVLFLKNQIPLPIVQLARLPNKKENTKAAKLKIELLSAFDTLASHLVTTFSALSTALAKSASAGVDPSPRVYMAIVVGSSPGTAKSKVFYGVDKLETRVWGNLDSLESEEEEIETGNVSGEELPEESDDDESGEETRSGIESEGSDQNDRSPEVDERDESDDGEEEGGDEDYPGQENMVDIPQLPLPSSHPSYAEEQRFLQNAERLLARTLASADADGHGISNEMSPMQTHVLIRAPRRFSHPAWVPRQNLVKQMESALADFLEETWPSHSVPTSLSKNKKKQVEGVWVTSKAGLGNANPLSEGLSVHEEDELIWWSWDGKIVGFTDW